MVLKNKLNIHDYTELSNAEERISKQKALELFDEKIIDDFEVGTTKGLQSIHYYLFNKIYDFTGIIREVNISKGSFRFAHAMYLNEILAKINVMPTHNFNQILKKNINKVVDWRLVSKHDYLLAMERSPIRDLEIKSILKVALTDNVNDRLTYIKGIDASYDYEGYNTYETGKIGPITNLA